MTGLRSRALKGASWGVSRSTAACQPSIVEHPGGISVAGLCRLRPLPSAVALSSPGELRATATGLVVGRDVLVAWGDWG
jgi:hypothetical protein